MKQKKYITKSGKIARQWAATRRKWLLANPPDYRGYWICGLCNTPTDAPDLDHILKKGSHPELRNDLTNLQPVHRSCHIKKDGGMR